MVNTYFVLDVFDRTQGRYGDWKEYARYKYYFDAKEVQNYLEDQGRTTNIYVLRTLREIEDE